MQFLIIMALMLGVMYVLMVRPQRQKQSQQQAMINDASVGDDQPADVVCPTVFGVAQGALQHLLQHAASAGRRAAGLPARGAARRASRSSAPRLSRA